jgi:hypothetical protein
MIGEAVDGDDRLHRHARGATILHEVGARVEIDLVPLVGEEGGRRRQQPPINRIGGGVKNEADGSRRTPERHHP